MEAATSSEKSHTVSLSRRLWCEKYSKRIKKKKLTYEEY
jgi:hypothetical protein